MYDVFRVFDDFFVGLLLKLFKMLVILTRFDFLSEPFDVFLSTLSKQLPLFNSFWLNSDVIESDVESERLIFFANIDRVENLDEGRRDICLIFDIFLLDQFAIVVPCTYKRIFIHSHDESTCYSIDTQP